MLREEVYSKATWQEHARDLREHDENVAAVQQARLDRHVSLWERVQWRNRRRQKQEEMAYDREAAEMSARLRCMVDEAAAEWQQKRRELEYAESVALLARREVEEVQRDGASIGRAAKVGAHFLGRLASQVQKAQSSYRLSELQ